MPATTSVPTTQTSSLVRLLLFLLELHVVSIVSCSAAVLNFLISKSAQEFTQSIMIFAQVMFYVFQVGAGDLQ